MGLKGAAKVTSPFDAILEIDAAQMPLDEHRVAESIQGAPGAKDLAEKLRTEARNDYVAFQFVGSHEGASGWGTHFGPNFTGVRPGGQLWEFPAKSDVTPDAVSQWRSRTGQLSHPVLVARYADLAWDLALIGGEKPDPQDARSASYAYLKSATTA